jgi:SPP1 family predicted phage head-tail adaptor
VSGVVADAGSLRTRLQLQVPVETPDGQGGIVRSYVDAQKIWARVTLLKAREDVTADAAGAMQRVRIETRAPLTLSLRHRLANGETIYRIVSYRDDGAFVTIDADLPIA